MTALKVKYLPRTVNDVITFCRDQITHPTRSWAGMCQAHCRTAYGVPAWSPSAIGAWHKIPARFKHAGGSPKTAPRGALLYYEGGRYGHVAVAAGKTGTLCLSNDYVRQGHIDYAPRSFARWGLKYVGWSAWTPFGMLRI